MAGTDKSRPNLGDQDSIDAPVVVLVDPQLPENIGAVARAMLNCGLTALRLVRPRDGWPQEKALAAASGADTVLAAAGVFSTTAEAIADLHYVQAATSRGRDMNKRVLGPRRAAMVLHEAAGRGERCGILFGPERSGLVNDDIALADAVITAKLNPAYRSLNLAQAVLLVAYEWFALGHDGALVEENIIRNGARPASKADVVGFFQHLEAALIKSGFLGLPEKRPIMQRNIRNIFLRAGLLDHEVRTLRGIVTSLTHRHRQERDDS